MDKDIHSHLEGICKIEILKKNKKIMRYHQTKITNYFPRSKIFKHRKQITKISLMLKRTYI